MGIWCIFCNKWIFLHSPIIWKHLNINTSLRLLVHKNFVISLYSGWYPSSTYRPVFVKAEYIVNVFSWWVEIFIMDLSMAVLPLKGIELTKIHVFGTMPSFCIVTTESCKDIAMCVFHLTQHCAEWHLLVYFVYFIKILWQKNSNCTFIFKRSDFQELYSMTLDILCYM